MTLLTKMTVSIVASAQPVRSAVPSRNSTRPAAISEAQRAAACSRMIADGSTPTTCPPGSTAAAAS
jgi:hypothetical protein